MTERLSPTAPSHGDIMADQPVIDVSEMDPVWNGSYIAVGGNHV